MEKNLQTAATSNSGHSKKTLLIALSIIAALLILAGAVLAVFIVQQTKFEKQTITLIQNGEYEEASSAVIDKKLSNRQKTALSTAFTNALKDAKIKVVSDLSEAKIQEYQCRIAERTQIRAPGLNGQPGEPGKTPKTPQVQQKSVEANPKKKKKIAAQ